MAERFLPVEIQLAMSVDFERANATTVGDEYHNKYLKLVEDLSTIYSN